MQGASSFTSSANLAVNAGVQGLGPRFKVSLLLKNDGQKPITNLVVKLMYNDALYEADKRSVMVPLLVPSLQYVTEVRGCSNERCTMSSMCINVWASLKAALIALGSG